MSLDDCSVAVERLPMECPAEFHRAWSAQTAIGMIEPLTKREAEVMTLICEGLSNQEICKALGVTYDAVKFHMKNIYGKLGASRRTQAVAIAVHFGLVRPEWLAGNGAMRRGIA